MVKLMQGISSSGTPHNAICNNHYNVEWVLRIAVFCYCWCLGTWLLTPCDHTKRPHAHWEKRCRQLGISRHKHKVASETITAKASSIMEKWHVELMCKVGTFAGWLVSWAGQSSIIKKSVLPHPQLMKGLVRETIITRTLCVDAQQGQVIRCVHAHTCTLHIYNIIIVYTIVI